MDNKTNNKLPQRKIGNDSVPALGFGLMSLCGFYTENTEEMEKNNLALLTQAADAGETFWDTSDLYGPYKSEELVGKWFKQTGRRSEIFLATKFGIVCSSDFKMSVRGDKEYVREAFEASLKRLGTDY